MGRVKVPIKFMGDPKPRNATFIKRRKGLKKKAMEFGTLCGVDVCMICFGPQGEGDRKYEPEIFPDDSNEVRRIIKRYEDLPKEDQNRRKQNLVSFLVEKKIKLEEEFNQRKRDSFSMLYPSCDDLWKDLPMESLLQLLQTLKEKLKLVNMKIDSMKEKEFSIQMSGHPNHIKYEDNIMMNRDFYRMLPQPLSYMNPSFDQQPVGIEIPFGPSYGNLNTSNTILSPPLMKGSIDNPGMAMQNYDSGSSSNNIFPCHFNEFYSDFKQFQFPTMVPSSYSSNPIHLQSYSQHQTDLHTPNFFHSHEFMSERDASSPVDVIRARPVEAPLSFHCLRWG